MKCSVCRTNEATIHIRNDVNGVVTEMHICPDCAAKKGMIVGGVGGLPAAGGTLGAAQPGANASHSPDVPNPFVMDTPLEIAAHPENLIAQLLKQFPPPMDKTEKTDKSASGSAGAAAGPGGAKTSPLDGLSGDALEAMEHLTKTGRFRAAADYALLETFLGPMLQEIQAGRQHRGKAPSAAHIPQQTHLRDLKKRLANAITGEDYEQAAALRDQIHALESRSPSSSSASAPSTGGKP